MLKPDMKFPLDNIKTQEERSYVSKKFFPSIKQFYQT